jgi:hypothetical protein
MARYIGLAIEKHIFQGQIAQEATIACLVLSKKEKGKTYITLIGSTVVSRLIVLVQTEWKTSDS